MNNNGLNSSNSSALKIKQQLGEGKFEDATRTWNELEGVILDNSNNVNFCNFLLDGEQDPVMETTTAEESNKGSVNVIDKYSKYLMTKMYTSPGVQGGRSLEDLMNIREKLKIIPENVTWGGQGGLVFPVMTGDFMKPRIQEVDELLAKGINVTIYNGQAAIDNFVDYERDVRANGFAVERSSQDGVYVKGTLLGRSHAKISLGANECEGSSPSSREESHADV